MESRKIKPEQIPMSEIWQLSAIELAHRIAKRELSSVEVVNAHLARIDAINPALNAIVKVLDNEARAEAASADPAARRGRGGRSAAWRALHGEGEHRHGWPPHHLGRACTGA